MFGRIVLTALVAGLLSGIFVWGAHMTRTSPLIVAAEVYENQDPAPASSHAHARTHAEAQSEAPAAAEWAPADGLERHLYTLLADVLTAIGFAFVLTGAIALSGRAVDWRQGIVWGLAGFAAFYVSPSFGLAPELPGMQAAELSARQGWWLATAAATAAGLALLMLQPRPALRALGVLLVVLPHAIGAPAHQVQPGAVPAELAAEFAVATLVVTGLFWMVLGGLTGYVYDRLRPS